MHDYHMSTLASDRTRDLHSEADRRRLADSSKVASASPETAAPTRARWLGRLALSWRSA